MTSGKKTGYSSPADKETLNLANIGELYTTKKLLDQFMNKLEQKYRHVRKAFMLLDRR